MEEREEYKRLEELRAQRLREQKEELEEQKKLELIRAERMREEQIEHEEYLRLELSVNSVNVKQTAKLLLLRVHVMSLLLSSAPGNLLSTTTSKTTMAPMRSLLLASSSNSRDPARIFVTDIGSKGNTQPPPPTASNGEPPRFTMCIDQTMKMDYVPPWRCS